MHRWKRISHLASREWKHTDAVNEDQLTGGENYQSATSEICSLPPAVTLVVCGHVWLRLSLSIHPSCAESDQANMPPRCEHIIAACQNELTIQLPPRALRSQPQKQPLNLHRLQNLRRPRPPLSPPTNPSPPKLLLLCRARAERPLPPLSLPSSRPLPSTAMM